MAKGKESTAKSSPFFIVLGCLLFVAGIGIGWFWSSHVYKQALSLHAPRLSVTDYLNPSLPPGWAEKEKLPGNSFQTSFELDPGITTQGTLNLGNVLDYYSFTLKDPSQITVDVSNIPKTLSWVIYDANYKQVAYTIRSGTTAGSTRITLQNPGKYYLRIWANYADDSTNYPYTIRLSILPFFD